MISKNGIAQWFHKNALALIVTVSVFYTFLLLFRWQFTGLTAASTFGRVWQYYVTWTNFGFHRRGIVGTILSETGINRLAQNEFQFAYIFYSLLLILCYYLVIKILLNHAALGKNHLLSFCIFLSPVTFARFAYGTGNLDLILCLLFLLVIFYVQNIWLLSALLVCGIFTHELFFFLLPALFFLQYITLPQGGSVFNKKLIIPNFVAMIALLITVLAGRLDTSENAFNAVMAERIPIAAEQESLALGYFEVSSERHENIGYSVVSLWKMRAYTFLPTLYVLVIAGSVAYFMQAKIFVKLSAFTAILFPLLAITIAADYYRWVSLSGLVGLICILQLTLMQKLNLPKNIFLFMMIFSLLSPFGPDVLARPFPIQQTILEKL